MAATLGYYNPQFYAAEALQILMKSLGFANTLYHGYEQERNAFRKGDTINIRKPGLFSVGDAPQTAQDVVTESISITLDKWKEVKFKLTDKELSLAQEVIIAEHIAPAAYAIADYIDSDAISMASKLCLNLSSSAVAREAGTTTSLILPDMTKVRKAMFDGMVPMNDSSKLFCMIDPGTEAVMLQTTAFNQQAGAGSAGVNTQVTGRLGPKFGINWFANQNKHTTYITAASQTTATILINNVAGYPRGTTTINMDGASSAAATLTAGSILKIGNYNYRVTALNTAAGSAWTGVVIDEPLHEDVVNDQVVTPIWLGDGTNPIVNIPFYHRNAMALVSAPLSEMGNELGARIFTVQDPVTGISLRARLYYVGADSAVHVALDVLYGYKVLNNNLGGTWKATPV